MIPCARKLCANPRFLYAVQRSGETWFTHFGDPRNFLGPVCTSNENRKIVWCAASIGKAPLEYQTCCYTADLRPKSTQKVKNQSWVWLILEGSIAFLTTSRVCGDHREPPHGRGTVRTRSCEIAQGWPPSSDCGATMPLGGWF